jgi:hypothetical protein
MYRCSSVVEEKLYQLGNWSEGIFKILVNLLFLIKLNATEFLMLYGRSVEKHIRYREFS